MGIGLKTCLVIALETKRRGNPDCSFPLDCFALARNDGICGS
jgi:hypothetical protein